MKSKINIHHGRITHSGDECESCPECIRTRENFEKAKADGSLDRILNNQEIT